MAVKSKYTAVIPHRSRKQKIRFIVDIVVATNAGQLKTGSASEQIKIC